MSQAEIQPRQLFRGQWLRLEGRVWKSSIHGRVETMANTPRKVCGEAAVG